MNNILVSSMSLPIFQIFFPENKKQNLADTDQKIRNISLGTAAFMVALPTMHFIEKRLMNWMQILNFNIMQPRNIIAIFKAVNNIHHTTLKVFFKVAVLGYRVFIGPYLEEWFFREKEHNFLQSFLANPESLASHVLYLLQGTEPFLQHLTYHLS